MKLLLCALITFLLVIIFSAITQAQNSLTHNTGSLEVTTIDNGFIGDNYSGTYGGIVFNGNQNAMAMAGLIFGQYGACYGSNGAVFQDFYNEIPIAGFFSHPYFGQYAYYTLALSGNPGFKTFIETFSNTGQDFVFLRANISNDSMDIDDLYPGIFADWDIGSYPADRGGYVPSKNLFYMYENGGSNDSSYYGIMGIAVDSIPLAPGTVMGLITDSIAWNRLDFYNLMTSTAFDTITTDGDYRMYICLGPHFVPVGSTLVVDMAIVAGTSFTDLLVNAQDAINYASIVPVEKTNFIVSDFSLSQNFPNPFNPSTKIRYSVPQLSKVIIKVFDVLGREVETLVNEEKSAGTYELEWNTESAAGGLSSGVYIYQIRAGSFVESKKMILLK